MSTELTHAMILNGVVLLAVLEADIGPHRKIGKFRIGRPLLLAAAIVPIYLTALTTHGTGLALELAGAVAGLLLGLLATSQMHVYRSRKTGGPASRAGWGYAAVWTAVIGARAAFSFGAINWFPTQLDNWLIKQHVTGDAVTNTLILMAVAMLLTRTIGMAVRAHNASFETDAETEVRRPVTAGA